MLFHNLYFQYIQILHVQRLQIVTVYPKTRLQLQQRNVKNYIDLETSVPFYKDIRKGTVVCIIKYLVLK